MRQTSARKIAYSVLLNVEREKAYSNIGLDKALRDPAADEREKSLATRLVYGVLERQILLDSQYRGYLDKGVRLKPGVRVLLRMGVYEILYLDAIPARASVNEYVSLAKQVGAQYAAGLLNAVLRKVAQAGETLPDPACAEYLSVRYSVPEKLIDRFREAYGDELQAFLESLYREPRLYGRVNTVKTDLEGLTERLGEEAIGIAPVPGAPELFCFTGRAPFAKTKAFREGLFYIQDLAAACAGRALAVGEGMRVLDVCAAPGGKTFYAAIAMNGAGRVVSRDIYAHKIALIEEGCARLGLQNVTVQLADATVSADRAEFDRVICDVPCSGLGVIRKKPEMKYRPSSSPEELSELQYRILCASADALKPGGRLVYSTCTVTRCENEDVVRRFLASHPDFREVREPLPAGTYGELGVRFSPHRDDCDGFYVCAMQKERADGGPDL